MPAPKTPDPSYSPLPASTPLPAAVTCRSGPFPARPGQLVAIDHSRGNPYQIRIEGSENEPEWYRRHHFSLAA